LNYRIVGQQRPLRDPEEGEYMSPYAREVLAFLKSEDGPTAVEYAVMLAFIITVCFGAIKTVGNNTNAIYSNSTLNTAVSSS
jgi:pilus assembly protein Flp/PilA